jgi:hypothetical protein
LIFPRQDRSRVSRQCYEFGVAPTNRNRNAVKLLMLSSELARRGFVTPKMEKRKVGNNCHLSQLYVSGIQTSQFGVYGCCYVTFPSHSSRSTSLRFYNDTMSCSRLRCLFPLLIPDVLFISVENHRESCFTTIQYLWCHRSDSLGKSAHISNKFRKRPRRSLQIRKDIPTVTQCQVVTRSYH